MSEFSSRYFLELQPLRHPAFEFLAAMSVWADTSRSHRRLVIAFENLRAAMEEVGDNIDRLLSSGLDDNLALTKPYVVTENRLKPN